jgi:hypothetical protein
MPFRLWRVNWENLRGDKLLYLLCLLIWILSLIDALFTIYFIETEQAIEANLLMDFLYSIHPVLFFIIKIFIVSIGLVIIWKLKYRMLSVLGIYFCFIFYLCILCWHIYGVFL